MFVFDCYHNGIRISTETDPQTAIALTFHGDAPKNAYVIVTAPSINPLSTCLNVFRATKPEDVYSYMEGWEVAEERKLWKHNADARASSKDAVTEAKLCKKDHINPSHYQAYMYIPGLELELQWLEAMQYLPRYRNPEVFKGAVELQARKYLDRLGGKDESSQEIMKSIWYLKFLAAYVKNGNKPIFVKDIETILAS